MKIDPIGRFTAFTAHHNVPICAAWLTAVTLNALDHGNALAELLTLIVVVPYVASAGTAATHRGFLCGRCLSRIPVDGPARAEKHQWWLHLHHQYTRRLLISAVGMAACVASFWWYPLLIIGCTESVATAYMLTTHRRLQLWCPWCRGRDGWDESVIPPVSTGKASR